MLKRVEWMVVAGMLVACSPSVKPSTQGGGNSGGSGTGGADGGGGAGASGGQGSGASGGGGEGSCASTCMEALCTGELPCAGTPAETQYAQVIECACSTCGAACGGSCDDLSTWIVDPVACCAESGVCDTATNNCGECMFNDAQPCLQAFEDCT